MTLTGHDTTVCRRKVGTPPIYLPCGTPSWLGAAAATTQQWDNGAQNAMPNLPFSPILPFFTIEWETYTTSVTGPPVLHWAIVDTTGNYTIEVIAGDSGMHANSFDVNDVTNEDFSYLPDTANSGRLRWALQADSTHIALFREGVVFASVARTTGTLSFTQGSHSYMFFFVNSGPGAPLQWSRWVWSKVARYPLTGYDPDTAPVIDANTILNWRMIEGSGTTTTDTVASASLYFDSPPAIPAWYATPPP